MATSLDGSHDDGMKPLFDLILKHVKRRWSKEARSGCSVPSWKPIPISAASSPAASRPGSAKPNQPVKVLDHDGKLIETGRITKVLAFRGLERMPVEEADAGDIVAIAGLPEATVAMTICDPSVETPLPAQPIDRRRWP